jgi:WD40 repeat protein
VTACAWSPDGRRIVSASYDQSLRLWDAESGACLRTFAGHTNGVSACAWSPDGRRIVSASYDRSLRLWDAESGACPWRAILLPDGQLATLGTGDQPVRHATPEAWRFLGWRWRDPGTGRLRILPAETFGPLPS